MAGCCSIRDGVDTLIERGAPEVMLSNYVREKGADLTVIGAYERGRLFHAVVKGKGPPDCPGRPRGRAGGQAGAGLRGPPSVRNSVPQEFLRPLAGSPPGRPGVRSRSRRPRAGC